MAILAALLGTGLGIVAALFGGILAERARTHKSPSISTGFFSLFASIIFAVLALTWAKNVLELYFELFACAFVAAFMLSWALVAWRAYKWMQKTEVKAKEAHKHNG